MIEKRWWWLRSPGNNQNNAANVNNDGGVNDNGNNVNNTNVGVRPALLLYARNLFAGAMVCAKSKGINLLLAHIDPNECRKIYVGEKEYADEFVIIKAYAFLVGIFYDAYLADEV